MKKTPEKMKQKIKIACLLLLSFFIVFTGCNPKQQEPIEIILQSAMHNAEQQLLLLSEYIEPFEGMLPRTVNGNNIVIMDNSHWDGSGFFPGSLWYIYENTTNEKVKYYAELYTERLKKEEYAPEDYSINSTFLYSFGNALRLTNNPALKDVLIEASKSLSSRYRKNTGCIQSSQENIHWECPVFIGNIVDLEMLMWVSEKIADDTLKEIAISHANTTMHNHFRPDYSSYHLVSYFQETGGVQCKQNMLGYSNEGVWARDQAWALYGYTMMYRKTNDPTYLNFAKNIANYIIKHPNLPKDKIPYWNFDAPNIPNEKRDASAGAIICSALIELSQFVNDEEEKKYLAVAEQQLRTLSSAEYTAPIGTNGNFILMHSMGTPPHHIEEDVPQAYCDYFYLEAITRFMRVK